MKDDSVRKTICRGIGFVFGVFLLALNYNVFLLPNNLIVGSMSGLAIALEAWLNINSTVFIYATSFGLLIMSFIFLGKSKTKNTIIGSIIYPIMVSITKPIAAFLLTKIQIDEFILLVCLTGLMYGTAEGIIYKNGFSTGGADVLMHLLCKYLKIPESKSTYIYSYIIIFASGLVLGVTSILYSIVILVISTFMLDKILIGISTTKAFFVCTKHAKDIKDIIYNEFDSGFTLLPTKSEFYHKKGELIMVVMGNRDYYAFRSRIMDVDPDAFFIITDCYEVNGGKRKSHKKLLDI